jgi:hypothetical protein
MADRCGTFAAPAATPDAVRSQDAPARRAAGEPPAAEPALTPPGPAPPLARQLTQVIWPQRKPGAVSAPGRLSASVTQAVGSSGGRPLDSATRVAMEPAFGTDLSGVRLHSDRHAAQAARDIDAYAFTHGEDIFFGAGQFRPATTDGRRLLAHELAHVMQASGPSHLPPSVTQAIQGGGGERLPDVNRAHMESALGADLSGVRIHRDPDAAHAANDISAHAFTVGQEIYFGAGQYDPGTKQGNRLLAHELTHTLQQASGTVTAQAETPISSPADPLERDAEAVAASIGNPSPQREKAAIAAVADGERQRLSAADTTERQAAQRLAGNTALAGSIRTPSATAKAMPRIQRQGATAPAAADEHAKIERALRTMSYLDIPDSFGSASDEERVGLSRLCIAGGYVAPEDAVQKVFKLWSGMGDRLRAVVSAHVPDWESATRFAPALMTLPPVTSAQDAYRAALQALADGNLQANQQFVDDRMKALGLGGGPPLSEAKQAEFRHSIQALAWHAFELRQQQQKHRSMEVGYNSQNLGFGDSPVKFDPSAPPKYRRTMFSKPDCDYDDVKKVWQDAEDELAEIGNDYPEIYEANAADEDGAALRHLSEVVPEHFGEEVKQHLLKLRDRIKGVRDMISNHQLDLLDLPLITQSVLKGAVVSPGRDWTAGFDHWAGERVVDAHKADQAAVAALLKGVEMTALIVGTFTGGLGRIVAVGVAVGLEAFQAGQASVQAERLQQAATVTPLIGTALASKAQADAKKAEAIANMVKAVTNALLLGGAALAEGLQVVRLRGLVGDEVLLTDLRKLAQDDAALEELLRRTGDPQGVKNLLTRAGSAAEAKKLLDTQELFRQRFAERYAKDLAAVEKAKAENPELGQIPTEDLVALRGYSAEDYDMINRALRGQEPEAEMERLQPYIDSATSGLDQLPVYQGTVKRIESNTYADYPVGEVVTKEAFTSSYGPGGKITMKGNTELRIESLTGRNIAAIAKNPVEAEVLFKPGTRFYVVSNTQPVQGAYTVHLREVP